VKQVITLVFYYEVLKNLKSKEEWLFVSQVQQNLIHEFKAEIYVLKKEEGGRHTPFHNKYRPQFYFRTTDVTGEIS
jgi:hypothetical protein